MCFTFLVWITSYTWFVSECFYFVFALDYLVYFYLRSYLIVFVTHVIFAVYLFRLPVCMCTWCAYMLLNAVWLNSLISANCEKSVSDCVCFLLLLLINLCFFYSWSMARACLCYVYCFLFVAVSVSESCVILSMFVCACDAILMWLGVSWCDAVDIHLFAMWVRWRLLVVWQGYMWARCMYERSWCDKKILWV